MKAAEVPLAVAAGVATASALDLKVEDAVVLHDSNRLAVRLLPCDVLARVAPVAHQAGAAFEVEVARRLAETDSPVAELDPRVEPRVYVRDGFAVTLWTYYEPVPSGDVAPREYAHALERLHDGMRPLDLTAPHFTDRVEEAQRLVGNRARTPGLTDADRELLSNTLRRLRRVIVDRGATEQLLHGEPHHGNLLRTKRGLLFIDLETCCRGPIEFDIAHCAPLASMRSGTSWYIGARMPEVVSANYPAADLEVVRACWILMLAMVATWRWDRRDHFPNGRQIGVEFLSELRAALDRYGLDVQG
ncbi:MAG: phosphotransferase [Dehalococcoidia bacterium]|nr:phosphotransferase [Dehalococcoidia bacterium]